MLMKTSSGISSETIQMQTLSYTVCNSTFNTFHCTVHLHSITLPFYFLVGKELAMLRTVPTIGDDKMFCWDVVTLVAMTPYL